jgi:phytoene dehydrogenase-like protein
VDAIVIGAGFGGLGAALTLAEQGANVLLLEALNYPGGCASTFERDGYQFEAGATLFSGFGADQLMARWIEKHGLDVAIDWPDPLIELTTPSLRLPVPPTREELVKRLAALPNAPVEGLERFFRRQEQVANTLWALFDDPELLPPFESRSLLTHLGRSGRYLPLLGLVGRSLTRVLERDGVSEFAPLRTYLDALCQITVQASAAEAEAPFALAATDYTFRGTGHVRGGIGKLAWALTRAVETCGGSVQLATRVRSLQRHEQGWEVTTKKKRYRAPVVVANLLPRAVTALSPDVALTGELAALDALLADGWGAAMLYLGLDGAAIARPEAHHLQLVGDEAQPFVKGNHVFCSISAADEHDRAPAGERTATLSTHVPMQELLALPEEERGGYIAAIQARMWRTVSDLAPHIAEGVRHTLPASPRTFERFTRRPDGIVGGVPRRTGLYHYRRMIPGPIMPGLYLVGDTVFPGQSTLATAIGGSRTAVAALRAHG